VFAAHFSHFGPRKGRVLGKSEESLIHELLETVKLDGKHRGELAELAFMRTAANLGFGVAKPWGDSDRYDVVVRVGRVFWRVQVKSVLVPLPSRVSYRVKTTGRDHLKYSSDEIDFLAAYIFAKDTWYVFPAAVVEDRESLCVRPGSPKCRFEQYREAWDLMKSNTPGMCVCGLLGASNQQTLVPKT
jgi:PD-(D/E)XK endonuclease